MTDHKHRKNSLRLKGYDYSQSGAYFVTTVTHQRECLFGEIENGIMHLNDAGKIVQWEWERLASRFDFIELGAYQVMPNHFHGNIVLFDPVGATRLDILNTSPTNSNLIVNKKFGNNPKGSPLHAKGPLPKSLSAIIGQFKSRATKHIWKKIPILDKSPIWQRGFHDRIIRNKDEWNRIHLYIEANPANWTEDHKIPINL